MPEFLSDAWLAALDDAARTAPPVPDVAPFVIEQLVDDPDDDARVAYHLVFSGDGLRVHAGRAERPDVTLETDRETAARLARGETNAQQALASGRFRLHGDIDALTRRASALRALDDVFVAVRAETSYR